MGPDEAARTIIQTVQITRADIVAAKVFLAEGGSGRIDMRSYLQAWAETVSPEASRDVYLDRSDIDSQLAAAARAIAAQLVLSVAAWELVHAGVMF